MLTGGRCGMFSSALGRRRLGRLGRAGRVVGTTAHVGRGRGGLPENHFG